MSLSVRPTDCASRFKFSICRFYGERGKRAFHAGGGGNGRLLASPVPASQAPTSVVSAAGTMHCSIARRRVGRRRSGGIRRAWSRRVEKSDVGRCLHRCPFSRGGDGRPHPAGASEFILAGRGTGGHSGRTALGSSRVIGEAFGF